MNPIAKSVCFLILSILVYTRAAAQDFEFHPPPSPADPATPAAMRDLAGRVLPVYQERDPERYLRNLSSLQLVAGDYGAAEGTRRQLRDRQRSGAAARFVAPNVALDMYSRAKAEAGDRTPFAQAFARVYKSVVPNLSDADAYALTTLLAAPLSAAQEPVQRIFDQRRSKGSLTLGEAVDLISAYVVFDAYRSFAPLVVALNAEDDRRRYTADSLSERRQSYGNTKNLKLHRAMKRPRRLYAPKKRSSRVGTTNS